VPLPRFAGGWDIMSGSLTGVADYTAQRRLTLRDSLEQPTCVEEGNAGTLCDAPGGMPFAFNSRWRSPRTGLVNMCWERSDRMPLG